MGKKLRSLDLVNTMVNDGVLVSGIWIMSSIDPIAGDGEDGNFWLNTTSNYYFTKESGSWTSRGSLQGQVSSDAGNQISTGTDGSLFTDPDADDVGAPDGSWTWNGTRLDITIP